MSHARVRARRRQGVLRTQRSDLNEYLKVKVPITMIVKVEYMVGRK